MDMKELKKLQNARKNGVPERYADREVLKAEKVHSTFVNDEPIVVIRKPKNQKNKDTGAYERVFSKAGNPIFAMVAYIPIKMGDTKAIIATASEENISIVRGIIEGVEPKIVRGEGPDDANRWEEYTAPDVIEGSLRFTAQPKKYHDGKVYDVAVLDTADD